MTAALVFAVLLAVVAVVVVYGVRYRRALARPAAHRRNPPGAATGGLYPRARRIDREEEIVSDDVPDGVAELIAEVRRAFPAVPGGDAAEVVDLGCRLIAEAYALESGPDPDK